MYNILIIIIKKIDTMTITKNPTSNYGTSQNQFPNLNLSAYGDVTSFASTAALKQERLELSNDKNILSGITPFAASNPFVPQKTDDDTLVTKTVKLGNEANTEISKIGNTVSTGLSYLNTAALLAGKLSVGTATIGKIASVATSIAK